MKGLGAVIRSLFSLGFLGLVFFLMGLAVLAGSLAAVANLLSFNTAWQRIDALAALQDTVSGHLRQMQIEEMGYYFAVEYETPPGDALDRAAGNAAEIDRTLDELIAAGHFTTELGYYEQDIALLDDFRDLLDEHRHTFAHVVQTLQPGDLAEDDDAIAVAEEENYQLQDMLEELIVRIDADRLATTETLPLDVSRAIQGISLALVGILLLALWGYRAVALLAQPVADLTNAVIAVGGDRYRPELLQKTRQQGGVTGRFARALDAFAQAIEQRDASLKQKVHDLREQLYESRRSRLKIHVPNSKEGAQP